MAIKIDFTPQTAYLHARGSGTFGPHDLVPALASIFAEYARGPWSGVLIDVHELHGDLPTMERYKVGILFAEHAHKVTLSQPGRRVRIAIVGKPPLIDAEMFVESVATNRGANLKVFTEVPAAIAWLEED